MHWRAIQKCESKEQRIGKNFRWDNKKDKIGFREEKKGFPLEWLGRSLAYNPFTPKDVISALKSTEDDPYKIIAEIKKAPPSKGGN